jgi:DNA-binding transcriptional ArsR family regulator
MLRETTTARDRDAGPLVLDPSAGRDGARTRALQVPQAPPATERVELPDATALAALLRLLSDPTRLRLLLLLSGGERTVTDLCTQMAVPQPTVSHHLSWLRASRLVAARRSGKNVFYAHGPAVVAAGDWLSVGSVRIRMRGDA